MPQPPSAMPAPRPTVVVGGTIAIDHVKTPDAEAAGLLGGSAAYAALAASFFCRPVGLIGIIGHDFPQAHLDMLESRGVSLAGVERSPNESFTWSGEYHANMNERTTHRVGLNVLENWRVKVPAAIAAAPVVVLANMSPDNQLEMLAQCGIGEIEDRGSEIGDRGCGAVPDSPSASSHPPSAIRDPRSSSAPRFVIADTMDLWIEIANERLHDVLPKLDLFVLNEGEARELAGTSNLVRAGRVLLGKGPRHVVIKLGEFGAMLFSRSEEIGDRRSEAGDGGCADVSGIPSASSEEIGDRRSEVGDGGCADIPGIPSASSEEIGDRRSEVGDGGCADVSGIPSASSYPQSTIHDPRSLSIFRCAAWPLEHVADPTGAGDTFLGAMAGYLAAQGPPPYDASVLRQAVIQGSILASFTCEAFSTRRLEALQAADLEQRLQQFRQATSW